MCAWRSNILSRQRLDLSGQFGFVRSERSNVISGQIFSRIDFLGRFLTHLPGFGCPDKYLPGFVCPKDHISARIDLSGRFMCATTQRFVRTSCPDLCVCTICMPRTEKLPGFVCVSGLCPDDLHALNLSGQAAQDLYVSRRFASPERFVQKSCPDLCVRTICVPRICPHKLPVCPDDLHTPNDLSGQAARICASDNCRSVQSGYGKDWID